MCGLERVCGLGGVKIGLGLGYAWLQRRAVLRGLEAAFSLSRPALSASGDSGPVTRLNSRLGRWASPRRAMILPPLCVAVGCARVCVRAFWLRVCVSFRSFDLGLSSWLASGGAGREISTDRVTAGGIFMIPVAPGW